MSRIGLKPIPVPQGVTIDIGEDSLVSVKGPKGELSRKINPEMGIKIEDALLAMADRVDSLDVRFFVTAVLIRRQTGGDLAEVLDKIGSLIRERIQLFGLVQGLTAEGRLSGWVLFALPIVVFFACLMVNPDYARDMLVDPRGKMLLFTAGGMQLMGMAMIRWIVNIKV